MEDNKNKPKQENIKNEKKNKKENELVIKNIFKFMHKYSV